MKNLKKFGALLLALVMILSLSLTAFAAEGDPAYSITISNPAVGDTYSAYKIFDATVALTCTNTSHTHDDTCYNVSYTIKATYDATDKTTATGVWAAVLKYMNITTTETNPTTAKAPDATTGVYSGNGLTLTPSAGDPSVYVVSGSSTSTDSEGSEVTTNLSAANFAEYLATQTTGWTESAKSTAVTAETDGTVKDVELDVSSSGAGYYLVTCTNTVHQVDAALAELTTTRPTVTIQDKNDIPFEKTVDDTNGVEIGQTVTYTITGEVPSTAGYDKYVYKVSDKMSQGLTFDLSSVNIRVGSSEVYPVTSGTSDWTVTGIYGYWDDKNSEWVTANASGDPYKANDTYGTDNSGTVILIGFTAEVDFTLTGTGADDKKENVPGSNLYTVGEPIEITYSATVNDAAVSVISENEATLTFSNDPGTEETTTPVNADVYSAKIAIYKFDSATAKNSAGEGADPNYRDNDGKLATADDVTAVKMLSGAEFVLYRYANKTTAADNTVTYSFHYTDTNTNSEKAYDASYTAAETETIVKVYYKYTAEDTTNSIPAKVEWVEEGTDSAIPTGVTKKTTNENGNTDFSGLENGTYYLLETKAPDGYNLLDEPVEVVVEATTKDDGSIDVTSLTVNADVANSAGTILPSTGGTGTTIFYIVGGILVLGAAVLLITKRRMNAAK